MHLNPPNPEARELLLRSLMERARAVSEGFAEADEALLTARAYLAVLARRKETRRSELHRAARLVRTARQRARWLSATVLVLHARAQELAREGAITPTRLYGRGVRRPQPSGAHASVG